MGDYKEEINQLKEKLEKANTKRVQAKTRMDDLEKQREKLITEIKEHGIDPGQLDSEIKKLEEELSSLLKEAKELLPDDEILSDGVDF